jgi:hypothetical protein
MYAFLQYIVSSYVAQHMASHVITQADSLTSIEGTLFASEATSNTARRESK